MHGGKNTVAYEARYLKALLLDLLKLDGCSFISFIFAFEYKSISIIF
jgi:hypothetical protein